MDHYYLLDWDTFRDFLTKPEGPVFVMETETEYIFETVFNHCLLKYVHVKGTPEENIIFVDTWITRNPTIRKAEIIDQIPKINIAVTNG